MQSGPRLRNSRRREATRTSNRPSKAENPFAKSTWTCSLSLRRRSTKRKPKILNFASSTVPSSTDHLHPRLMVPTNSRYLTTRARLRWHLPLTCRSNRSLKATRKASSSSPSHESNSANLSLRIQMQVLLQTTPLLLQSRRPSTSLMRSNSARRRS